MVPKDKLLHVPRLLATPTIVADSSGSLSSLALRRHNTKRGGKGSLEVVLVNGSSIGRGNGVGTSGFLPVPLALEWKQQSDTDGINSTLSIQLSDIVSFQRDGTGNGGSDSLALEFRTPLDCFSDTFTFRFTMSTSTSSVFLKSIQYLMEWNRDREEALLEQQGIGDQVTAPNPVDIGRLAHRAAEMGDVTGLVHSFCQGHSVDTVVADNGDTILLLACRRGHWDIVNTILLRNATLVPPEASQTAIHAAVEAGSVGIVRRLLDYAASTDGQPYVETLLNCMDENSMTPLHCAVSAGNLSIVRLCIERGANVSSMVGSTGQTAVHVAAETGNPVILSVLLEVADPSLLGVTDLEGYTPLMSAVAAGRHANIRCVLDLLNQTSLMDESFDGSGALQITRREAGMSGIARHIKDRVRHLKTVNEEADALNLTGLARNQYRAKQFGLRGGAPTPLLLPPSSSSVRTPVAPGGDSAVLTTENLGVGTKEMAATKVLPTAKISSNVSTKMVSGDDAGPPGPPDAATASAEEKASSDVSSSAAVDTGKPLKDDEAYATYFKMMKMGIPAAAVKNKMGKESVDPAILDLDPEKSYESQKHLLQSEERPKKKPLEPKVITGQKSSVPTTPVHWIALAVNHSGSLWNSDANPLLTPEAIEMIKENFPAESSKVVVPQAVPAKSCQTILTTKWHNNTEITMKPFCMVGVANMYDVVDVIYSLRIDSFVTLERAESLFTLLQTMDRTEVEAVREFSGDPADLCRADRFIHITTKERNRFLKKLEMFRFAQRYDQAIKDLHDMANKILDACDDICENESIGRLLFSLLGVGNFMNENSKARSGRAVPAVHLSTLFEAALKKGKGASIMDVAVTNILGWNGDEVQPIVPTLKRVKVAERIDLEFILQEFEVLQKGVQKITDEITLEKQRPSERGETGDSFIQNASAFLEEAQLRLKKTQAVVHAAKEKVSAATASLELPQSGDKAMKVSELAYDESLRCMYTSFQF